MKRVSFEVAKAIKAAGYTQYKEGIVYLSSGKLHTCKEGSALFRYIPNYCCDAPTYLDVWLWLCREKHTPISCSWFAPTFEWFSHIKDETKRFSAKWPNADPEDVIIAAIEDLVKNNLVK